MVRAVGEMHSMMYRMKVAARGRCKGKLYETKIKTHVSRILCVGALLWQEGVQDSQAVIKHAQEDVKIVEMAGLTTRQPEKTFEEMLNTIRDSLSNPLSSDDAVDGQGEDNYNDTKLGKLSLADKTGWVIGTITKMVQQRN